jgi:hypothetical protein
MIQSQWLRAGLWTFVITLVPIIHLIVGYFPVNFSVTVNKNPPTFISELRERQLVITMCAYYAIRTVMLLYCDSFRQMRALWFSRIATSINWCVLITLLVPLACILSMWRDCRCSADTPLFPLQKATESHVPF